MPATAVRYLHAEYHTFKAFGKLRRVHTKLSPIKCTRYTPSRGFSKAPPTEKWREKGQDRFHGVCVFLTTMSCSPAVNLLGSGIDRAQRNRSCAPEGAPLLWGHADHTCESAPPTPAPLDLRCSGPYSPAYLACPCKAAAYSLCALTFFSVRSAGTVHDSVHWRQHHTAVLKEQAEAARSRLHTQAQLDPTPENRQNNMTSPAL